MSAGLKTIRKRIKSVQGTAKITKAMKMVATAKLRRSKEAIDRARPYADGVRRLVSGLASRVVAGGGDMSAYPLLAQRPQTRHVELLVITASRGLCGGFNTGVPRAAERFVRERRAAGQEVTLTLIGRKARDYFKFRPEYAVREVYELTLEKATAADAAEIAVDLRERFVTGAVDEVFVISTRFKSAISQVVQRERLLPIATEVASTGAGAPAAASDVIYEPGEKEALGAILPLYLNTLVFTAIMDSAASEQGARMTAMDNATRNAKQMISKLTLRYNRARQASITKELMEIIGGAEALKG